MILFDHHVINDPNDNISLLVYFIFIERVISINHSKNLPNDQPY